MKKVNRETEPDFWIEYKSLHPNHCYMDLDKSIQGRQARQDLRNFLLQSQFGLCAYCCRRIGIEDSLNEHIKPQAKYPKQTMDYENIIVSCRSEGSTPTCGSNKANEYDEALFVSPLEECEGHFIFYPNGQIEGIGERGQYTCDLLNLNVYELQRARRAQYKICMSYQNEELVHTCFLIPDEEGKQEPFADMIQFFYERGDFGISDGE